MIDVFVLNGYILAVFWFIFGGFLFWLGVQAGSERPGRKSVERVLFFWRWFLNICGVFYVVMAFIQVYLTFGTVLTLGLLAPCENIVVNATDISSTVTVYGYENSCEARTVPATTTNTFILFTWSSLFIGVSMMFFLFIFWLVRVFSP